MGKNVFPLYKTEITIIVAECVCLKLEFILKSVSFCNL